MQIQKFLRKIYNLNVSFIKNESKTKVSKLVYQELMNREYQIKLKESIRKVLINHVNKIENNYTL